jgi:predicted nucleotidyltransferase
VGLRELAAKCVDNAVRECGFIAGVVLFGSVARGEEGERSDVDLLVLWEGLDKQGALRIVYEAVSRHFPPGIGLTVLEAEYWSFVSTRKLTPLLINIAYDGVILHDKYGKLNEFLSRIKHGLSEKGLVRRRLGESYHWVLPKPGSKVVLYA